MRFVNMKKLFAVVLSVVLVCTMLSALVSATDEDQPAASDAAFVEAPAETDEPQVKTEEPVAEEPVAEDAQVTSDKAEVKSETKATDPKEKKEEEDDEYPAQTLTASAGSVKVTLKAPKGSLPKGAKLTARAVGQKYVDAVDKYLEAQDKDLTDAVAIDVTPLDKDGKEVQPKKPVAVTFSNTNLDLDKGDAVAVYRVSDDAASVTAVPGGGSADAATFTADHFTIYVQGGSATNPNADGSRYNTASNPKVIQYGQTLRLNSTTEANTWGILTDPTQKPPKGSETKALNGVSVDAAGRTYTNVTNNSVLTTEQIYIIHHHSGDSQSREDYYIKALPMSVTFMLQDAGETSFAEAGTAPVIDGTATPPSNLPKKGDETTDTSGKTYVFTGWCEEEDCTTEATLTGLTANKTVYGKYELKECEVEFMFKDVNASSFEKEATETVISGSSVEDKAPTHEDTDTTKFLGWYTDEACETEADLSKVLDDMTVYGKNVKKVTLSYEPNTTDKVNGLPDPDPGYEGQTKKAGDAPTRSGYIFTKWTTKASGSGDSYEAGADVTLPGNDMVLYAQWEEKKITVTYHSEGYDDPYHVDENVPASSDYEVIEDMLNRDADGKLFLGWTDEEGGTDAKYGPKKRLKSETKTRISMLSGAMYIN